MLTDSPMSSSPQAKIDALSEAIRAVTGDLSLDRVLRRLAEIAAHLVNARYSALGIPDDRGGLKNFFTYGMTERQVNAMDHLPIGHGLLGALMTGQQPLRLEDMRQDGRSVGFCAHHPRMTSFLGVPILSKGQHLGSLYLSDRLDDQPFTEDDERMIQLLAAHAAIAIENARLSDQLRRLAVVEERDRIAMELHDGIIQSIYAIGIKLELARTSVNPTAALDTQLSAATNELNRVIEDLRHYIQDLKTGVNLSVALTEQLQEIAQGFRSVCSARLVMDIAPVFSQLTEAVIHTLTQVVREAFSNIVRHADATEVHLDLHENAAQFNLVIADNGHGFNVEQAAPGSGLQNMRRRAEQLGGTLQVASSPAHGTTVTLALPR